MTEETFGPYRIEQLLDMRLVEGSDLSDVIREGAVEPARAVRIVEQVASALLNETPPKASPLNPAVPEALDDVIAKGMAKKPAGRYATAGAFARAAAQAPDHARTRHSRDTAGPPPASSPRASSPTATPRSGGSTPAPSSWAR
jgi:serine/threonine protein kinase